MSPEQIQAACEATLDPQAREALHALLQRVLVLEAGFQVLARQVPPPPVPQPPAVP